MRTKRKKVDKKFQKRGKAGKKLLGIVMLILFFFAILLKFLLATGR